ncbi:MAG: hypothetical protein K0S70_864 [Microbacterium sp.]|uniref:hypothetical protein n=1 Tax=Microbacterium sp. Kw_RZR3 TaxID=3032903 RepID=UPI0023DB3022|nr:hypothetical protein [Microbacterium sp. Kw_RZR3]MDF2045589.1 hypothetical protein [Microbacterium sp. Kw_RZR3]MDF2916647.1 hypothetical protein [Microbacterium sp.]
MNRFLSRAGLAAAASALLVSALAYLPMIVSGHLTRDSGVFLYTGMVVSRGGMPYVDSWDHKGPLLAAIEAVAWKLGGGIVGAPMLEGVALFLGLAVAGVLWSRMIGYAAAPAVLVAGVTYLGVFEGGNFTETWLFPLQLVAYSAAAHLGLRSGREASVRATASVGLVLGLALAIGLFTRMNNIVGLVLVVAVGAVYLRRRLLFLAAVSAVVVAVGVGLVLWLWMGNALRAGIDQYVRYNLFYSGGTTASDRLAAFGTLAQLLVSGAVVVAVLVLAGAWLARRRREDAADGTPTLVAAVFFAVGGLDALSQMVSGRPYPHYLVVAIAGFAVAGVVLASRLLPLPPLSTVPSERLRSLPPMIVAGGAVLLVLAGSSASALQWARIAIGSGVFVAGSYQAQLVDRVVAETNPNDRVLVHGAETWILAASERLSPTSITYSLPVEQGYGGLPAQYLSDVTSFPPALIVESPESCGISIECPYGEANFEGLAPFVASSYRLEGDIVGFRFWRRNVG